MRVDPGFSTNDVLTAQVAAPFRPNMRPTDTTAPLAAIVERVSALPGVVHASLVSGGLPLAGGNMSTTIAVPGRDLSNDDAIINARVVTPDYHPALGIPLRGGRLLAPFDRSDAPHVVLLNESAAKKYFPGEDPVGRLVNISNENRTVVGIVGDVHQSALETEPRGEAYVPLSQVRAVKGTSELVIRTAGEPYQVLPAVKAAMANVIPDVPLRNVRTMEELFSRRIAQRRLNMLLLGLFGLLGLVISAAGIYGVITYAVSQRVREIGVRMALGATVSRVVVMILTNAAALVAAGLVIGAAGAWYLSAAAKAFLFGLEPHNPWAFAGAVGVLFVAASIASIIPAGRAAKVDPMLALRAE